MSNIYNPPRAEAKITDEPLEIELVYHVRPCGTCSFFWPKDNSPQAYGPFPTFDFDSNYPLSKPAPSPVVQNYPWLKGTTSNQGFPNGEVMDGCRKAPIMTIGINPNLTAFSPSQQGTSWIYPSFTDDNTTDAYAKYAYYYRYRSVYQEHLNLTKMESYLSNEGEFKAAKAGVLVSAERAFAEVNGVTTVELTLKMLYEGDTESTTKILNRSLGEARYVLLYDHFKPNNKFEKNAVIAALLTVPEGEEIELIHGAIGYYEQFVPVLNYFEHFLQGKGFDKPQLRIGEDVGQLDMVACASPHWNESFMGGQLDQVVHNCVQKNAWAIKQLVQTKPVVLFLVGESSYDMFNETFGKLIQHSKPLSDRPVDGAFTLFHETIDPATPTYVEFKTEVNGESYELKTRLVVAPHFSYDTNYVPQYRMSIENWESLKEKHPKSYDFIHEAAEKKELSIVYAKDKYDYIAVQLQEDPNAFLSQLKNVDPIGAAFLQTFYYNPHLQMADLLGSLYDKGLMQYEDPKKEGESGLKRTDGSCHFCFNHKWEFPLGCPYGKTKEKAPTKGFLKTVAQKMVAAGV